MNVVKQHMHEPTCIFIGNNHNIKTQFWNCYSSKFNMKKVVNLICVDVCNNYNGLKYYTTVFWKSFFICPFRLKYKRFRIRFICIGTIFIWKLSLIALNFWTTRKLHRIPIWKCQWNREIHFKFSYYVYRYITLIVSL